MATAARARVGTRQSKQSPYLSSYSSHSPLGVLAYRLPPSQTLPHRSRSGACVRAQAVLSLPSLTIPPPPSLLAPASPSALDISTDPPCLSPPSLERSQLYCTLGWVIRGSRNGERERERGRERQTGDGSELLSCAGEEDHLFFNEEGRERGGGRKKEAHRRRGSRGENSHRQTQLSSTFT